MITQTPAAPAPPSFPSHVAARVAASYVPYRPARSADEALRRVQTDLAYDLRDRQLAETTAAEIAGARP